MQKLLMPGFKLTSSGVGGERSANCDVTYCTIKLGASDYGIVSPCHFLFMRSTIYLHP